MKRFMTLCALLLILLTSCGQTETQKNPDTAPQADIEEPAPELEILQDPTETDTDAGNWVLSSVDAAVDGGRVLRLDAIGKTVEGTDVPERYAVSAVRVYEGDTLLQTILIKDVPPEASEGEPYAGESETLAPSVETAISTHDMNFDGFDDLDLCAWTGTGELDPHYYYLWNSVIGAYLYAYTLRGAVADPETREVLSTYRQDSNTDCTDYYRYTDSGTLILVSRRTEDWKRGSEDFPLVEYYGFQDGNATLIREEFTNYDDRGYPVREVREIVRGELTPVRREMLEVSDGEIRVLGTEELPIPDENDSSSLPETQEQSTAQAE